MPVVNGSAYRQEQRLRNDDPVPSRADVVIIGSGIVGLSTAFHLTEMSRQKIVVLDRGPIGGVASPRAAGSIRHHYSHPMLVELAMRGHQFFREFEKHTGASCGYVNNGYVVGVDETQSDWLEENVRMVRECGVNTGLATASEVRTLFPELDGNGWSGPLAFDRDSGYVQPQDVMRELARSVRERGVHLIAGDAVCGMAVQSGRVQSVETESGSTIRTGVVVNAAGAWGADVSASAGVDLPVTVGRLLQIFELRPAFHLPVTRPTISDGPLDLYARPNPGNRLLIGARHYFDEPRKPDEVDLIPDQGTLRDTRDRYERLNPSTRNAAIHHAWAGIDGDTPDFQPIVGPTPGVNGLLTAVGFSAHGFKLGPAIGRLLAEQIVHGTYRTQEISRLGFERLTSGDLFPPGYKQMGA